ncbi:unnamed protein product [Alopecurus aequalis]
MASPKRKRSASKRRDRIGSLTDDVLGHVLSFLPTEEAACCAALSRRWRHVFGSVHSISFEEAEGERDDDWATWYFRMLERKSCSYVLLDNVNAALLSRRRCAGFPVPLRSLRFAFDSWHWWDKVAVDQWLSYALPRRHGGDQPDLHLDISFNIGPICVFDSDDEDDVDDDDTPGSESDSDSLVVRWTYVLPRRLFSCTALRTLCIRSCRLKLRRTGMVIQLPFLDTLRLTLLGDSGRSIHRLISSCPRLADLTLEALWNLNRVSVLNKCLCRFALRCCHTTSRSRYFDEGFPLFSSLTRLTLQGCIRSSTIVALRRILEQSPNLEVLTLLMEELKTPDKILSLPCLRHRLREVSIQDYEGSKPEKMLVKLLLRSALVLERLHVVFADGLKTKRKTRLEVQMRKWGVANSENIFTSVK